VADTPLSLLTLHQRHGVATMHVTQHVATAHRSNPALRDGSDCLGGYLVATTACSPTSATE